MVINYIIFSHPLKFYASWVYITWTNKTIVNNIIGFNFTIRIYIWLLWVSRSQKFGSSLGNVWTTLLYTEQIFRDHMLSDLLDPIPPNNVYLYEDQLQSNLNVFSLFDDEEKAWHQLFMSKKLYPRIANLLYWYEHYASITDIPRLYQNITKHVHHMPSMSWKFVHWRVYRKTSTYLHLGRLYVNRARAARCRKWAGLY